MAIALKGYKKRLAKRRILANRLGRGAFYQTKSNGTLPRPWYTLIKMAHQLNVRY